MSIETVKDNSTQTQSTDSLSESATQKMLKKVAENWDRRAQVRKGSPHDSRFFNLDKPDFPTKLLPFANHPDFDKLTEKQVSTLLSYGWLAYCEKTLDIENHIVTPTCIDIVESKFIGLNDDVSKQLAAETMVDESYHVLLTINACTVTKSFRNISINFPPCILLTRLNTFLEQCTEAWQKDIVKFVTCCVSEIFISDYLLLLSSANEIQPLHRQVVDAHRKDELAHRRVFLEIAKLMYRSLSKPQQIYFSSVLVKPVQWFSETDFDTWYVIFENLNLGHMSYLLQESADKINDLDTIDYTGIIALASDLGIDVSGTAISESSIASSCQ